MEKSLISEIKRYHEIMGIKSVIVEQKATNQAIEKGLERLGIGAEKIAGRGEQLFSKLEGQMEKMSIPKTELESLTAMFERGAEGEAEEKLTRMLENEPFRRAFTLAVADEFPELLAREAETFAKGLRTDVRDALSAIYKAEGSEGVERFLKSKGLWNDEYAEIYRAFKPAEETITTTTTKKPFWQEAIEDAEANSWRTEKYAEFRTQLRKAFPQASDRELDAIVAQLKKAKKLTPEEFAKKMESLMDEYAPGYARKYINSGDKLTFAERMASLRKGFSSMGPAGTASYFILSTLALGVGTGTGMVVICGLATGIWNLFVPDEDEIKTCFDYVYEAFKSAGVPDKESKDAANKITGGTGGGSTPDLSNDEFYKKIIQANPKLNGLIQKAGQQYYLVLGGNNYPVFESGGVLKYKGGDNKEYPITDLK